MKTRIGKIARLPRALREQINRRLADSQSGLVLLRWLNRLPEVRQTLAEHFAGKPISKQNLSEWKAGGFTEWLARQEIIEQGRELAADADDLRAATQSRLSDHLAVVLSARYASLLAGWNGQATPEFTAQLQTLSSLTQEINGLRWADHSSARVELERQRLELVREKSVAEKIDEFEQWADLPEVRDAICQNWKSPEERAWLLHQILDPNEPYIPLAERKNARHPAPETSPESNPVKPSQTVAPRRPSPKKRSCRSCRGSRKPASARPESRSTNARPRRSAGGSPASPKNQTHSHPIKPKNPPPPATKPAVPPASTPSATGATSDASMHNPANLPQLTPQQMRIEEENRLWRIQNHFEDPPTLVAPKHSGGGSEPAKEM